MNILILCGRIATEVETRYTQTGKAVTSFNLAVDNGYGDNKKTVFISCTAWEKTAETIANTLAKGRKIVVTGRWDRQEWEKDGQKHRKDYCLVNTFEYADSKKETNEHGGKDFNVNSFGADVIPYEDIPF